MPNKKSNPLSSDNGMHSISVSISEQDWQELRLIAIFTGNTSPTQVANDYVSAGITADKPKLRKAARAILA